MVCECERLQVLDEAVLHEWHVQFSILNEEFLPVISGGLIGICYSMDYNS